jgi:hypothetical protein
VCPANGAERPAGTREALPGAFCGRIFRGSCTSRANSARAKFDSSAKALNFAEAGRILLRP